MNFLWTHPLAPSLRGCGPNCFHPFSFFIFIRTLGEREGGNDWEEHLHSVEVQAKTQNTNDAKWTAKFNKLAAFQAEHGHLSPPVGHELNVWTSNQRTNKLNNKLCNERITLLDGLGFEWNLQNAKWTAKFNKLVAFKAVHNNLKIPQDHELYIWTYNQRSAKNNPKSKLKLNDERIGLLDGLGFEW